MCRFNPPTAVTDVPEARVRVSTTKGLPIIGSGQLDGDTDDRAVSQQTDDRLASDIQLLDSKKS